MNITFQNSYLYTKYSDRYNNKYLPVFTSAKDISLKYLLTKRSEYLPERIKAEIIKLIDSGRKDFPQLWQLHNEVYLPLMEAKTLEEAKQLYPEFNGVKDIVEIAGSRSKAVKAIKAKMPLEEFTLEYLKRIYAPNNQQSIVEEFGFTMRSLLDWLNKKLNIQKLSGNYLNLVRMSKEDENNKVAERSRRAIFENPEAQIDRLQKAADAHRTVEYRTRKSAEMRKFYVNNPEYRKRISIISQLTWDRCPEIKAVLSEYRVNSSAYIKKVISKESDGARLTENEARTVKGFYYRFWRAHPELLEIYQQRRVEVIKELRRENPSLFLT